MTRLLQAWQATARVWRDPNPVLMKELRGLFRTPLYLRFLYLGAALIALVVISAGVIAQSEMSSLSKVGQLLFHLVFSLAAVAILLIAPVFGATAFSAEREARTLESLLLTGVGGWRLVRGKVLAGVSVLGLQLVALAPVAAISLIFGGVSPGELFWAYFYLGLFLVGGLSFGVALSSRFERSRVSIILALLAIFLVGPNLAGLIVGASFSFKGHFGGGFDGPFWMATVLSRSFSHTGVWLGLFVVPTLLTGMATWFFMATSVIGITPPGMDRSAPLKWWTLGATGLLAFALWLAYAYVPVNDLSDLATGLLYIAPGLLLVPLSLLFINGPLLPLRGLPKARVPWLRSRFGPGLLQGVNFTLVLMALSAGLLFSFAWAAHEADPSPGVRQVRDLVGAAVCGVGVYVLGALWLLLAAHLRAWGRSAMVTRVLALVAGALLTALPWVVTLLVDERALKHLEDHIPAIFYVSPAMPHLVGLLIADEQAWEALGPWTIYVVGWGAVTLALYVALKLKLERRLAAREKAREEFLAQIELRAMLREEGGRPGAEAAPAPVGGARPLEAATDTDAEGEGEGGEAALEGDA